jgi:hypothetical protein
MTSQRFLLLVFLVQSFSCFSQANSADSTVVNRKKLAIASTAVGVAYATSMVVLANAWYDDSPKESFHFFDDAPEWKQMDKAGHFFSAFHITDNASTILRSCNVPRKKSDIIGAVTSMVILSSIEVFDGYSAAYGASMTDVAANAAGSLFYLGQSWGWKEMRIYPKFSFHSTAIARERPEVLGRGASEIIKNYNGQTMWLSVSVAKFMPQSKWPRWLNVAGGYGAEEMFFARDLQNKMAGRNPYRQYYLSLDVDLTAIPVRSKFLKSVLKVVNIIKVPAPTVEFSRDGIRVHALYF